MELNGKRVLVVGLGKSGVASALFMKAHGARVTVSDTKSGDELRNEIPVLLDHGITVETGGHGERTFRGQDLIVVSPGVPVDAPPLVQARSLGETVIGEIELAAQFLPGPIVAITGSNGKTTTTTLTGEIMTAAGFPALVGGNIGTPAISLAERAKPETVIVLEVSSFQLETIQTFRPKVAVVLNVTPDHLDRHRTFETYVDAKARIFENQQANDFAVLNADDPTCVALGATNAGPSVLVQPPERSAAGRLGRATATSCSAIATGTTRDHAGLRDSAERRAQSGKCSGGGLRRRADGMRPGENPPGRPRFQGGRAPPGIRGDHQRRRLLQRFQSHQRRRHHQGAGIVSRRTST